MLVQDKSPVKKSPLSPGVKVTIKNNKIQSITKSDPEINHDPSSFGVKTLNASSDDEKISSSQELSPKMDTLKLPQIAINNSRNHELSSEEASIIDLCNENSSVT